MVAVDLCCGDGLFTAPLCGIASRVYAIDIDPDMLDRARTLIAGRTNCQFILADAMNIETVVSEPVDYVLLANTFHGVPDKTGLARAVAAILKPRGRFIIVNWHRRPREETVVLGQPRGPELRCGCNPTRSLALWSRRDCVSLGSPSYRPTTTAWFLRSRRPDSANGGRNGRAEADRERECAEGDQQRRQPDGDGHGYGEEDDGADGPRRQPIRDDAEDDGSDAFRRRQTADGKR